MVRRAYTMELKPGAFADYKHHHDHIWPDLVAEMERQGIRQCTIFHREPHLFLYSEITDEAAWDRMWATPIQQRWAKLMVNFLRQKPDRSADVGDLEEIFHLALGPGAGE